MLRTLCLAPHRRGVTLIEVVISIFVLTMGIVGIISLFPAGYRMTRKSVERSVAALASRHALARVYGRINNIAAPLPAEEPLMKLPEARRVGVIYAVQQNALQCRVMGNEDPKWTGAPPLLPSVNLTDYYVVMTSGSAEGHLYKITSNGSDTLNFDPAKVRFNVQPTEREYEPVRVGDTFAIIGVKGPTGTKCYPKCFTGDAALNPASTPIDPENDETRTMPVATYGSAERLKQEWRYSYGCIFSCPTPEAKDMCRLDVIVYSGFPYRAGAPDAPGTSYSDPSVANSQVIGRYTTYIPAGRKQ